MAGPGESARALPLCEALEQRLLLSARGLEAALADVGRVPAADATAAFAWSGYEMDLATGGAEADFDFIFPDAPVLTDAAGGSAVDLPGASAALDAAGHVLPVAEAALLLPPGTRAAGIEVDLGEPVILAEGVELPSVLEAADASPVELDGADAVVAPGASFANRGLAGYELAALRIAPVAYDAATGTLSWHPHVRITLTAEAADAAAGLAVREDADDLRRVLGAVANDSAAWQYAEAGGEAQLPPPPSGGLGSGEYDYLLITSPALAETFQPLVDHKLARGVSATLVTTDTISAAVVSPYAGEDDAAGRIREFIARAWDEWGTRYVLLGGDVATVPARRIYVTHGSSYSANLYSDMYFACLEGPYNFTASDGWWGRPNDGAGGGDVDVGPDVAVGRAPVDTPEEAAAFVAKTVLYETTPNPYASEGLYIGEWLDSHPTWGGDGCDHIDAAVVPDSASTTRLYERDGTYSAGAVVDAIDAGVGFIEHLGHSTWTEDAGLTAAGIAALDAPHPYVMVSGGCNAGRFQEDDAVAEHHLIAAGGAVATMMNSDLGWYSPGIPEISGTQWREEFWDALFGEGLLSLGDAHIDAKIDMSSKIGSSGSGRWLFFGATLFGDPETRFCFPRAAAPAVANALPPAETGAGTDRVRLTFTEPMDTAGFSIDDDVLAFTGPGGADLRGRITGFQWLDYLTLEIAFEPVDAPGSYELALGADIPDLAAQPMAGGCSVAFAIPAGGQAEGVIYAADMSADPQWVLDPPGAEEPGWQYGVPETGDYNGPEAGATGEALLAYRIDGPYADGMAAEYATTPAFDCRGHRDVTLHFQRWLRVHPGYYDRAVVQVSNDGQTWHTAWSNEASTLDAAWTACAIDISPWADGQESVAVRWGMGPTNASIVYCGWNLDDVVVTGVQDNPAVVGLAPAAPTDEPVDHVDVAFQVAMDAGTVGPEDVKIVGPAGEVEIAAVTATGDRAFRVSFEPVAEIGTYTVTVGPDVANLVGVAMDQDVDGTAGEAGEDAFVGTFAITEADVDPPAVTTATPQGQLFAPAAATFAFDEDMDTAGFSLADVAWFTGPGGDLRGEITGFRWLDARTLRVTFRSQTDAGAYELAIGPGVLDDAPGGNPLDQDGDGTGGEPGEDVAAASFEVRYVDLHAAGISAAPDSLDAGGGTVRATVTLANAGVSDAGAFDLRFYLSDDAVIDPGTDLPLTLAGGGQAHRVAGLAGRSDVELALDLAVPAADPFDTDNDYRVGVVIDAAGEVIETDETNNANAGDGLDLAPVRYGRAFGRIWHDRDGDGLAEEGEEPRGGQTVYLDLDGDGTRDAGEPAATTDAEGHFALVGVTDGTFVLRQELGSPWLTTTPADGARELVLGPGDAVAGLDFGNCLPASAAGTVFADADLDGVLDDGEAGLADRWVWSDLDGDGVRNASEPATQSGPDGAWFLPGLAPGEHTLCQDLAGGWYATAPRGGHAVVLASADAADGLDFAAADAGTFRPAVTVAEPAPGLRFDYHHHDGLTDPAGLDGLEPVFSGVAWDVQCDQRERELDFGMAFEGFFDVHAEGVYEFALDSDDGALLWIDGDLVVDNAAAQTAAGRIGLAAGTHAIRLRYLQADGQHHLDVTYRPLGAEPSPLPDATFAHDLAADTTPPDIRHAVALDDTHVQIAFDEPMDAASAEAVGGYSFAGGPAVASVALDELGRDVLLALAEPLAEGAAVMLSVAGPTDVAGNALPAGTELAVTYGADSAGLLAWWTFDDGTGTVAADDSGFGRDAAVQGAAWDPAGRHGGALRFDGNDAVEAAEGPAWLNGLDELTLAMWVRSDAGGIGTDAGLLTTRPPGDSQCVNLRYDADGFRSGSQETVKLYVRTSDDVHAAEGPGGLQTTGWQHLAVTWSAGQAATLYVDGVARPFAWDEGPLDGVILGATTLLIGQGCKSGQGWRGRIDDVRIFGRALSPQQVARLHNDAPVADDDAYAVDTSRELAVDTASGVLAGDADPDGGPAALTAELLAGCDHGQLVLAGDGSFTYVPDAGFAGEDRFTYRPWDGREHGNVATVTLTVPDPAEVVGRHVFYGGSSWAADGGADAAVAPDKHALLPGGAAGFANYTSYVRGLNGVIVDVARLASASLDPAADLAFRVGTGNDVASWPAGPQPTDVTVRPGEGAGGSDRITIRFPDGAVRDAWLEVTVRATSATGLADDDVFYFGNAVGETGNAARNTVIDAADLAGVRAAATDAAAITDPADFNRDGRVSLADEQIASDHLSEPFGALWLVEVLTELPSGAHTRSVPPPTPRAFAAGRTPPVTTPAETAPPAPVARAVPGRQALLARMPLPPAHARPEPGPAGLGRPSAPAALDALDMASPLPDLRLTHLRRMLSHWGSSATDAR